MIYQREANDDTRAEAETGFYKLDANGNEIKLVIKTEQGEDSKINISYIRNLNERYMVFIPDMWQYAEDIFHDHGPEHSFGEYYCFVDRKTDKISLVTTKQMEEMGEEPLWWGDLIEAPIQSMPNGDIYLLCSSLWKINIPNMVLTRLMPPGQYYNVNYNFGGANLDGYVLYDTNKILRPDGGIQVTSGQSFICNNQIYDISDNILNILNPGSGNDLIPQEICAMPSSSGAHELIVYNKVRKSLLIAESNSNTGYGVTYEFDGNSLKETGLDYSVAIQFVNTMQYNPDNVFKTSEAWYLKNGNSFIKIDFANWEVSNFTLNGIEIYEISANEDAPEFCFSGLNYSDASQVFGIVKSDDSVVISGKVPNTTKIVNMIPLN